MCGDTISIGDLTVAHFAISPMYDSIKTDVDAVFDQAKRVKNLVKKLESQLVEYLKDKKL